MQTTAPQRSLNAGYPGLMAEPFGPTDIRSCVQPAAKSYFGRFVVVDGEGKCKHPTATGQQPLGVVAASQAVMMDSADALPGYPAKHTVNVMRKGYIWVAIEEDIAIGDAVYFRHTANGAGKLNLGSFRNDADSATCDQLTNARWVKAGTLALGYALLELGSL